MDIKPSNRKTYDIISADTVYRGFFRIKKFFLSHELFSGRKGLEISRELFCRGNSAAVLLYDPESDRVGLVNQFRIGCLENEHGPWVWEVIAGVNDKGEEPEEIVIRETLEESGKSIDRESLRKISQYYNSPGGSDERLSLFCALTNLNEEEGVFGLADESEDILFKTFAYNEAIGAMLSGYINNAATIIALQWLQINRPDLRNNQI